MFWNALDRTWGPWQELRRIQSDMNRLFQDHPHNRSRLGGDFPRINLWSGETGLKLFAELPGFGPDDIDVTVVGDTVTLKGERKDDATETDEVHRRERRTGTFSRSFQLPFEIEADEVRARSSNGVLEVDLPRAHAQRPRQITVQSA